MRLTLIIGFAIIILEVSFMVFNYQTNRPLIRIKQIRMVNFKNVKDSQCQLVTNKQANSNDDGPNILGLYGQNGSGKTAVIDALHILKYVMSGKSVPSRFADCIAVGAKKAHLEFSFMVYPLNNDESKMVDLLTMVIYAFDLGVETVAESSDEINDEKRLKRKLHVFNEVISLGGSMNIVNLDGKHISKTIKLQPIIRSDLGTTPIGPTRKLSCLLGKNNRKTILSKLGEFKEQSYQESKSFLFSWNTLHLGLRSATSMMPQFVGELFKSEMRLFKDALSDDKQMAKYILGQTHVEIPDSFFDEEMEKLSSEELEELEQNEDVFERDYLLWQEGMQYWLTVLYLLQYAREELFVVSTESSGSIRLKKKMPLLTRSGPFDIPLNGPFVISRNGFDSLVPYVNLVNGVLKQLVPGLKLVIEEVGKLSDDESRVRILSSRDGKKYPLRFEADGVIRLISLLWLIIPAFNDRSFTLAIDEIDAGIYEYLLGDILKAFEKDGKGQLIFTSHNLRPLEVISKDSIVFTTTNPENRYIRLKRIGQTNNLRDVYLREIRMQEGEEELYNAEKYYEISASIRQIGIGYPNLEEETANDEE